MPLPRPASRPRPPKPPARHRLPRQRWQRRELVIWGAHGGAGTSTLAVWLQPAWDMGAMRPEPDPPLPGQRRQRPRPGRGLPQHRLVRAAQATKAVAAVDPAGRPGGRAGGGQRRLARARHRHQPVPASWSPRSAR